VEGPRLPAACTGTSLAEKPTRPILHSVPLFFVSFQSEAKNPDPSTLVFERRIFPCVIPTGVRGVEGPRLPPARTDTSLSEKPTRPILHSVPLFFVSFQSEAKNPDPSTLVFERRIFLCVILSAAKDLDGRSYDRRQSRAPLLAAKVSSTRARYFLDRCEPAPRPARGFVSIASNRASVKRI
jgi:hypothetical protein